MIRKFLIITCCLFLLFVSCAQKNKSVQLNEFYETEFYTIKYPSGWNSTLYSELSEDTLCLTSDNGKHSILCIKMNGRIPHPSYKEAVVLFKSLYCNSLVETQKEPVLINGTKFCIIKYKEDDICRKVYITHISRTGLSYCVQNRYSTKREEEIGDSIIHTIVFK